MVKEVEHIALHNGNLLSKRDMALPAGLLNSKICILFDDKFSVSKIIVFLEGRNFVLLSLSLHELLWSVLVSIDLAVFYVRMQEIRVPAAGRNPSAMKDDTSAARVDKQVVFSFHKTRVIRWKCEGGFRSKFLSRYDSMNCWSVLASNLNQPSLMCSRTGGLDSKWCICSSPCNLLTTSFVLVNFQEGLEQV